MTIALLAVVLLISLLLLPFGVYATLAALVVYLVALHRANPGFTSTSAPPGSKWAAPVLGLVLLVALVLRWPIASHDVEHYVGPDEGEVVENVLEMIKTGDFDHRHRGYPGLHFYLQMIPARAHLASTGKSIPDLPRAGFYLAARRLTLVAGLLAAVFVFWAGRRWLSSSGSALAAILVALSPLAFRESAVVNPDLMLMLFVLASLLFSLRLLEERSWPSFLLAGISVGVASAIKYTGVLALVPYLAAWSLGSAPRRDTLKSLAGVAGAGLAFVVTSPYTLLNLPAFVRGLEMHVGYYQAAAVNAPGALTFQLAVRGTGVLAAFAAFTAAARALTVLDKKLLVLLAYPLAYVVLFSFFDRAFPRHALVLVPFAALLAADAVERLERRSRRLGAVLGMALVVGPVLGTFALAGRARRATPATNAAVWVETNIPAGSRVLQDQFTPRLDPERFRAHRLRVEEKRFVGNFDWVLYSGYPPGLNVEGLREAARFENEDAIGDLIVVYQVPARESLIPVSFSGNRRGLSIRAGDLPFFGEGWYAPSGGAFETSRLSRGVSSEIFFVLAESDAGNALDAELTLGAVGDVGTELRLSLNDEDVGVIRCEGERESYRTTLPAGHVRSGLNRLELAYEELTRLNRRHPDTALRFYRMRLTRSEE